MASKNNPKGRQNDIVLQQLKDEVLIYDLTINKAYSLNETSALIWNLCDGNNSVADISNQLSKKLKQPVTDDLVWLALDQLKKDNLLSDNEKVEIKFDGLTRREVIRRVGFASMIAIPIITSLIAPTAAMAQSGIAPGSLAINATCTSNGQCASGNCLTTFTGALRCCANSTGAGQPPSSGTCQTSTDCSRLAPTCCSGAAAFSPSDSRCPGAGSACLCT